MHTKSQFDIAKLHRVAEILKTIAHPVRLSVLEILDKENCLSVSQIIERVDVEQSLLSHHLLKMKDKGILTSERDGKNILYQISDRNLTNIFECMNNCELISK